MVKAPLPESASARRDREERAELARLQAYVAEHAAEISWSFKARLALLKYLMVVGTLGFVVGLCWLMLWAAKNGGQLPPLSLPALGLFAFPLATVLARPVHLAIARAQIRDIDRSRAAGAVGGATSASAPASLPPHEPR
ncbi:MAG TPA: hypothetical protein VGO62_04625 [Myxococcota bacterium]|jgi:hypothetical protein